jgi:hypothetical protein
MLRERCSGSLSGALALSSVPQTSITLNAKSQGILVEGSDEPVRSYVECTQRVCEENGVSFRYCWPLSACCRVGHEMI